MKKTALESYYLLGERNIHIGVFLFNNHLCVKTQIQEMVKLSEVMNTTNTHTYMQAAVNVMFTQMNAKKGINCFGGRGYSNNDKGIQEIT